MRTGVQRHQEITIARALDDLPAGAFAKADPLPDAQFYAQPRFVTHVDEGAVAAVTELYAEVFPPSGVVLDLMSSWVSHLPADAPYAEVIGHGLNGEELAANPRLTRWFVQDLNADPALPLADASVDAAGCCASVQYLQDPVGVFAEVERVLRPGAPFAVTFSNRCIPTIAVAIWRALSGDDQARLVALYLERAGFAAVEPRRLVPPGRAGDPLWAAVGRAGTPAA